MLGRADPRRRRALQGYRSTTHWALHDALPAFGAVPVKQRVVVDRNRISGGGVTAGIDFGLTLLAQLRGEETARLVQLMMEYDPAPLISRRQRGARRPCHRAHRPPTSPCVSSSSLSRVRRRRGAHQGQRALGQRRPGLLRRARGERRRRGLA
ncbi:hypothetical protein [Nannocystis pusilla]|uniref:hypothetical protein n=1 Tax=Nannocystis pusilla TaxID=889268 RepID=UPI003B7F112E